MKLIALCLLGTLAGGAFAGEEIALSRKQGIVLRVWEEGLVADSRLRKPIAILPDGTVQAGVKSLAGKLSKAGLQSLLRFVVKKNKFLDIDEVAVRRILQKRQPQAGCGTGTVLTVVSLHIRGRSKTVRQAFLEATASRNKDIVELGRLRAIVERVRLEARLAGAGGRTKVRGWLLRANAKLAQQHPKIRPFALRDFQGFVSVPKKTPADGGAGTDPHVHGRCASFLRRDTKPLAAVRATVTVEAEPPAVDIRVQR